MKKFYSILLAVSFSLAVLAGCGATTEPGQAESGQTEAKQEVAATIILNNGEEELANKEVTVETGTTLMEVMKENFEVEESDGFINGLEGISMNEEEKMAWMYTINGEEAMVGANEYEIEQGDEITFDYQSWE
ncbi:DUF4430 domain-containing protein [Halobacillus litoralis]|uniref:DUF4430 domain-containing protein n=1 Tax=Halobacillus litoralis TaxID=45668 RepID=UPI001CD3BE68|nr:DUF4430 domain-containing protein [Halobacillus litoralis]MCA0970304.1 DUF4430 domain-containing protein [Halobacillus litoralis]